MPQSPDRMPRVVATLLAVVFLAAGLTKVAQLAQAVSLFEAFGLPRWSLFTVGFLELAGAGLLLFKRTRTWGAMAICVIMGGAALAHVLTAIDQAGLIFNLIFFNMGAWLVMHEPPRFLFIDWDADPHGHASVPRPSA